MMHNVGTMMGYLMKKDVRMLDIEIAFLPILASLREALHGQLNIPAAEFVEWTTEPHYPMHTEMF